MEQPDVIAQTPEGLLAEAARLITVLNELCDTMDTHSLVYHDTTNHILQLKAAKYNIEAGKYGEGGVSQRIIRQARIYERALQWLPVTWE